MTLRRNGDHIFKKQANEANVLRFGNLDYFSPVATVEKSP